MAIRPQNRAPLDRLVDSMTRMSGPISDLVVPGLPFRGVSFSGHSRPGKPYFATHLTPQSAGPFWRPEKGPTLWRLSLKTGLHWIA